MGWDLMHRHLNSVSFAGTVVDIPYNEQFTSLCSRPGHFTPRMGKTRQGSKPVTEGWEVISTPLQVEDWAHMLAEHPNTQYADP